MFELLVYAITSYALAILVLVAVLLEIRTGKRWMSWGTSRRISVLLFCAFVSLSLPLLPYATVETQTALWGRSLSETVDDTVNANDNGAEVVALKVLLVTSRWAVVYVVCTSGIDQDSFYALTVQLVRDGASWHFSSGSDHCVWSDSGNACGSIFPPYPRELFVPHHRNLDCPRHPRHMRSLPAGP